MQLHLGVEYAAHSRSPIYDMWSANYNSGIESPECLFEFMFSHQDPLVDHPFRCGTTGHLNHVIANQGMVELTGKDEEMVFSFASLTFFYWNN